MESTERGLVLFRCVFYIEAFVQIAHTGCIGGVGRHMGCRSV